MAYTPTIGLEIHAELKTRTKMFCASRNDPEEAKPNVNICPICLAHPGTLPVINREAVRHVLRVGYAVGGTIADYTEFDRKNYFYPDLPKGYQISQYEYPLVSGGTLHGVSLTRIHLEEDTASSVHEEHSGATTIDYNRAGVPLMELVTEPVIRSAEEAGNFARELQLLLRYLGASDANMEKGEMRVEANVSVGENGEKGTKVEIKNLNSFKAMERAVAYEIRRQTDLLKAKGEIIQETRGWDEAKQTTFSQRIKEGSADYRYFPDPDLPSLRLSELLDCTKDMCTRGMPELPSQRKERYLSLGVSAENAMLFVRERLLGDFFDTLVQSYNAEPKAVRLVSNYVANDLVKIIRDIEGRDTDYQGEIPISAEDFKKIIDLLLASSISSRAAKDILLACARDGHDPEEYASTHSLSLEKDDGAVEAVIQRVIQENPAAVADYRSGKQAALGFLVGKGMKELQGGGDPVLLRERLQASLEAETR